ncbi:MAG: 4Fe-4S dicluster domain-containing protein [Euryarchaeota archaeon]|nr:4Fe-4S dicluster domain-containing protein [Euryarchaeota archaeon]
MLVKDYCIGCGHCVPFCPQEAITVLGRAEIDGETCIECGICIIYCPNEAIQEDGG